MDEESVVLKGSKFGLGRKDAEQISHGLNLILKLKPGIPMLEVLARIRKAQRKIDAGLGELNFIHFARFLPTYNNRALQVITEFDGPLAPYVLDFAIEIGDVFDMLLSCTQGTKGIVPIAENAAGFLAFVEKHNAVTVLGTPYHDWPLYSAYPSKSVLDIAGPRDDLPIPKPDRWIAQVDRADVQGNILRGYRAEGVRHFLLCVVEPRKARAWLAGKARADDPGSRSAPQITSFKPWKAGTKPSLMLNIGLTHAGMVALKIRASWLNRFPEAFKQGALKRAADNFDVGANFPGQWWLGGPNQASDLHIMLSLYHKVGAEQDFKDAADLLTASLPEAGLRLIAQHDATYRGGRSWFGYADGIASPRIAMSCPPADESEDLQPAASAGEFVLGADYKNIYGGTSLGELPAAIATNGTFCAVRVLAQDTDTFDRVLSDEARRLNVQKDWLAAKLMGRWYNGAPISLHPNAEPTHKFEHTRNDFDYEPSYEYPATAMDHFGMQCPVGAHIRRSNPRTARVAGARYARRLMRRGMHYEIKDQQGRAEVGLFGLFICADLERQFEFIQRQWLNGDRFASGLRGTRDPFVGTPTRELNKFEIPLPGGQAPMTVLLPQLVRTKGSAYFFMPGLKTLRDLERFSNSDPPSPKVTVTAPGISLGESTLLDAVRQVQAQLPLVGGQPSVETEVLVELAQFLAGNASHDASAREVPLPKLDFDPRRRDFQIDPYPTFAKFRRTDPVHYSPLYDGWFVFRYDDVLAVCNGDTTYSAAAHNNKTPRGLFTLDLPEHTEVRKIFGGAWSNAARLATASVGQSVARVVAAIAPQRCFDLVDDFARPVPRDVYFDILGGKGIPSDERLELDQLARTVMKHHDHTLDPLQRIEGTIAVARLLARMTKMLALARLPNSEFHGSFLDHLGRTISPIGNGLNLVTALVSLVNLTVAGYMSVEFLLATGIRRLLLDPSKGWDRLRATPNSLDLFLPEMRRTEPALAVIDRFTKIQVKLSGVVIPAHARIFAVLASANRDELIFGNDADRFNPDRLWPQNRPHVAFGRGTHECMGIALEKMITTAAIHGLVAAKPGLRLRSPAQPLWFENFYFRSFDHLAVIST